MAVDFAEDLIATIPKNQREELRVSLSTFRGRRVLDVRVFVDQAGKGRIPTPKGLTVSAERIPALIAALEKAREAAEPVATSAEPQEQWWQR
jgi:hypothetical protein